MAKYYITTAIDYPNGVPHIGHALEKTGADVMARYRRMAGDDVFFLMGNDENSQKVLEAAQKQKKDPHAFTDEMAKAFTVAWEKLHFGYDRFIRTTEKAHHEAAQEIFRRILKKGDVYKDLYKSKYCVGCEEPKTEKDLENGLCRNHKDRSLELIEEENWFFRLSNYTGKLKDLVRNTEFVVPEIRRNEVLGVLEEGLRDISISRAKTDWGVPVPDDPEHVIYVWFDALINYVTGVGFPDESYKKWWPADVHVIGKDISRFHCIIWPAMLMAADIELPKQVVVHGFINVEGEKVSKSGVKVDPVEIAERYGSDALRYFLLREVGFANDGNFSWDLFNTRYNADLANNMGNLLNRVSNMTNRYFNGELPEAKHTFPEDEGLRKSFEELPGLVEGHMKTWRFKLALEAIMSSATVANQYLEATQPWIKAKEKKMDEVAAAIVNAATALRLLTLHLAPYLPVKAEQIWAQLGQEGKAADARLTDAGKWVTIKPGTAVSKGKPLFPRIEDPDKKK